MHTHTVDERRMMIAHIMNLLDHCANLLPYMDQYEQEAHHYVRVACEDSFMIDFRALYGFMLAPMKADDAHRRHFTTPDWKPGKSANKNRLDKMCAFINVHRAHLSWQRFKDLRGGIEPLVPPEYRRGRFLAASGFAHALSDYLDILDEFVRHVPDPDERSRFFGAAFNARHKVNTFMGLPSPSPVLSP